MNRFGLLLVGSTLAGALLPVACGDDERLSETGTKTPDAGSDAPILPPDSGKDAPGPFVRSVETRARFGSLDLGNYLLDGDFEYSGVDALQYPWLGSDYTWIVTGARCRNGLRCMEVPLDQYMVGAFVWPDAGTIDVEYYAKPKGTGACDDEVGGVLIPLADYPGAPFMNMSVSATDPAPGPDGWCHVTANFPVPTDTGNTFWALALAPRQAATDSVLFDDAAIRIPNAGGAEAQTRTAPLPSDLRKLVVRARADFARRPPIPPRSEGAPIANRTGRRKPAAAP